MENKKNMGQKAGLSFPTIIKLWPVRKESAMKTLCPARDITSG